jgi:23S rRNA pseudouridine2605 synthase
VPQERLQKVLAAQGVASRRTAEQLIAQGLVTVNGVQAHVGQVVNGETDTIAVQGRVVARHPGRRYIALNKPAGVVTSTRRQRDEQTVFDLLHLSERLYPVGRLDRDTSGLLLLTNDGDWANLVTHPRFEVEKEYVAQVRGVPDVDVLERLRGGVRLPDGQTTAPARVEIACLSSNSAILTIVLHEGKKRQIRLMLAAVGHPVVTMQRVRVGPIRLGDLPERQYRDLTEHEVQTVRKAASAGGSAIGE